MAIQRRRQAVPPDVVGPDVAERLRPLRIRVELEYQTAKPRGRERPAGTPPRESREYVFNMSAEVMDPGHGPALIARHVARELYRRLCWEGWPLALQCTVNDLRPGARGYYSG